ncbi:MAG: hypothetical protein GY710_01025 [Desulfobacteraceae bacterium]|nr:hypothetical protein [Desulfobacteraceae bacterium]
MYQVRNPIQSAMGGMSQASGTYGRMGQNIPANAPQGPNAMGTASTIYGGSQAISTAAPASAGVMSVGGPIAAAAAADQIAADEIAGITDPNETHERNARGALRYGGASPGMTSLIEKGLGKEGTEIFDKITDPTGLLRKAEGVVGKGVAQTIPEFLGGNGEYDPVGQYIGEYLFS